MNRKIKAFLTAATLVTLAAGAARADIITYQDGKTNKGIVTIIPEDPNFILFTNDVGKIKISKSRVKNIEKEPEAVGHIYIGQQYIAKKRYAEAIQEFQQALALDPGNAQAQEMLDQAQGAVSQNDNMKRDKAVMKIDELVAESNNLMQHGKFQEAIDLVKQADALVPNPEQKPVLAGLISNIYLRWAMDRLDRFDKIGAEEKLNLAYAANKDNDKVIEQLLKLWEGDSQKMEQAATVYETILDRHPEDANLRRKLADLYYDMTKPAEAAHHYLILYKVKPEQYQGSELEARLIEGLDRQHKQYARNQDFEKAIYYYKLLSAIDPNTDPTGVIYYEYLQKAQNQKEGDVAGLVEVARFAEQNGLDSEATTRYRDMLKREDLKAEGQAGLARYAQKSLAQAKEAFDAQNWTLAQTLAYLVQNEYPEVESVKEGASEILGVSQANLQRDQRAKKDQARDIVNKGHEFYMQALQNFDNIFSTERRNYPYLVSSRQEARKFFTFAIQSYEQALQVDPGLAQDPTSMIAVRLNDSRDKLRRLSAGLAPSRSSWGRVEQPVAPNPAP